MYDPTLEPITALGDRAEFQRRHIGTSPGGSGEGADRDDLARLLRTIGVASVDDLIDRAIPSGIRDRSTLGLGEPHTEPEVTTALLELAAMNRPRTSLIGQGYVGTITPPVIRRNLLENPAWYTSYTPYQAEISQGRLES
ncbi:MAG: hypothetical protein ACO3SP_09260, partial [Ilumatobacteraceae bacterium]